MKIPIVHGHPLQNLKSSKVPLGVAGLYPVAILHLRKNEAPQQGIEICGEASRALLHLQV
jgi:hypothetical protein